MNAGNGAGAIDSVSYIFQRLFHGGYWGHIIGQTVPYNLIAETKKGELAGKTLQSTNVGFYIVDLGHIIEMSYPHDGPVVESFSMLFKYPDGNLVSCSQLGEDYGLLNDGEELDKRLEDVINDMLDDFLNRPDQYKGINLL